MFVVGVVLVVQDMFNDGGVPPGRFGPLGVAGVITTGLGIGGLIVAHLIDPDPLDWNGKVEAATRYNAELEARLAPPGPSTKHTVGAPLLSLDGRF